MEFFLKFALCTFQFSFCNELYRSFQNAKSAWEGHEQRKPAACSHRYRNGFRPDAPDGRRRHYPENCGSSRSCNPKSGWARRSRSAANMAGCLHSSPRDFRRGFPRENRSGGSCQCPGVYLRRHRGGPFMPGDAVDGPPRREGSPGNFKPDRPRAALSNNRTRSRPGNFSGQTPLVPPPRTSRFLENQNFYRHKGLYNFPSYGSHWIRSDPCRLHHVARCQQAGLER